MIYIVNHFAQKRAYNMLWGLWRIIFMFRDVGDSLRLNWGWLLTLGIILFLLGIYAISLDTLTTLITVIFLGALILISGILILLDTFKFWWGNWLGFFLHFIIGVLYVVVGWMLIQNPISASISLTLLLGIFYVIVGLVRLIYTFSISVPQTGWRVFNSLITLVLGILILASWPSSSLFIIGLFVGIDLLVVGMSYIMIALHSR